MTSFPFLVVNRPGSYLSIGLSFCSLNDPLHLPFQIVGLPIMQVDGFPERVITYDTD